MLYHDGCEFNELWNCFICPKEGRQYFWQYHQFFKTHQAGSNQLNETAGTEYFIRSAKVKIQSLHLYIAIYRKKYKLKNIFEAENQTGWMFHENSGGTGSKA